MKGDFSRWDPVAGENLSAVLHQQGRVLLDRDWNDQSRLTMGWQDEAARQIIGAGVAAVSVQHRNAFLVEGAQVVGDDVVLAVRPGFAWADGLAIELGGDPATPVDRRATYLLPPVQDPPGTVASIASGVRDVVVLEVWREALNGFQLPDDLIEPALGGPDTTERATTAMRFRLFRLGPGEDCKTIADQLADDDASKGRLTVSLQPSVVIGGDCPVAEGGGYVGFEHHLYRVEIADTDGGPPMFKWSQFNGGLVGRGRWDRTDPANLALDITANDQAIKTSGLSDFYLEAVELDPDEGRWRVTYGADVTLNGSRLEVTNERYDVPVLPLPDRVFFRLWNEIRPLTDFPVPPAGGDPTELRDGIRLEFDPAANHRPGDYWNFEVRAGELSNPDPLVDDEPPHGVRLHRVALAELAWTDDAAGITFADEEIEDCREIFDPLTAPDGCCTYSVGDGVRTHGDFDSIEEALRHLPAEGGKICVLPGVHDANVLIQGRPPLIDIKRIQISGCGSRTIVRPHPERVGDPIFRVEGAQKVTLDHLTLVAPSGTAIEVHDPPGTARPSSEISIHHNDIVACIHGIDVRVDNGVAGNNDIEIAYNRVAMLDKEGGRAGIFSLADHVLIEWNRVVVVPAPADDPTDPRPGDDPTGPTFDPCADPLVIYDTDFRLRSYLDTTIHYVLAVDGRFLNSTRRIVYLAQGGIQLGGGSERVRVSENMVVGGRGHGVTLGHLPPAPEVQIEQLAIYNSTTAPEAAEFLRNGVVGLLYDVTIERNSIHNMGLSGVGVFAFMSIEAIRATMRIVDLVIYRNHISHCAQQLPDLGDMRDEVGFGGVSLADTHHALINENQIEHNGVTHVEPVCGIFILMGERVDISNNQILNNGPRAGDEDADALAGTRGGIVIKMSFKSVGADLMKSVSAPAFGTNAVIGRARIPDGIPAIKVHDNIVVQPLGHALFLTAMGPVSVVGNHLTSQGTDFRVNAFSLIAGAVFILNLGISKDLLGLALLKSFRSLPLLQGGSINAGISTNRRAGLGGLATILNLPNGSVLYANNATTLDLRDPSISFGLSAQAIASLDDVGYTGNYSECSSLLDVVLTDAFLAGVSVRTNDNRFQEGITFAFYSLMSFAVVNTAVSNQSTHCLLVWGAQMRRALNIVLFASDCAGDENFLGQGLDFPEQKAVAVNDAEWTQLRLLP